MTKIKFELTEQHLKLIENMHLHFDDEAYLGAPAVDIKRPYGNSSVYHDIGEILGIEPDSGDPDDPEFNESQQEQMLRLHKETATALQIIICTKSFEPGTYEADEYQYNWRKA